MIITNPVYSEDIINESYIEDQGNEAIAVACNNLNTFIG